MRVDGQSEWTVNRPVTAEPEAWRENMAQAQGSMVGGGQCNAKSGGDYPRQ